MKSVPAFANFKFVHRPIRRICLNIFIYKLRKVAIRCNVVIFRLTDLIVIVSTGSSSAGKLAISSHCQIWRIRLNIFICKLTKVAINDDLHLRNDTLYRGGGAWSLAPPRSETMHEFYNFFEPQFISYKPPKLEKKIKPYL